MKSKQEIRAQLAALEAERQRHLEALAAIANQEWSLLWWLDELPVPEVAVTEEGSGDGDGSTSDS